MPPVKYDDTYPWFSRVVSRKEKFLALAAYIVVLVASIWLFQTSAVTTKHQITLFLSLSIILVAIVATLGLLWLLSVLRSPTPASVGNAKQRMLPFVLGKPFNIQHQFRPGYPI